ncbi:MAG TPA: PhoPQ-activated protein PqaA family protein [Gammaproteobacteria bacterium]|nr:PhoPQ-activated protein PqaA family protein [Gammaproteobacteria bacterium]
MLRSPASILRCCFALLLTVVGAAAAGQGTAIDDSGALAAFVAKPDSSFAWRVQRRYTNPHAEIVELHLESQTWQGEVWKHQLLLVRPNRIHDERHAVFVVGGGRWREEYETSTGDEPLPEDGEIFVGIARLLRAPVVVLGQVPYQPLFGMTEDRLIAHTFERYLATGDPDWPLLLPMVNSVVRAFDASSEASEREWGFPLERFTLTGGSKRGWTTWLTAAVDPRVVALAPIVIDALNMERHFPHQVEAWGAPSDEIQPYTDLGLDRILASPEGAALRQIVDPFSYRAKLGQPKLVVLATNDKYFPLDSANLYFDELREPKYLLYLPNEQHSIDRYEPFVRALRALHEAAATGEPLPRLEWEYRASGGELMLCVRSDRRARRWRVWRAESADRDFRDAEWHVVAESSRAATRFALTEPAQGYAAIVGEAAFGAALRAYTLSTSLSVIAAPNEPPYGTQPAGGAGLCAQIESAPVMPVP